jgi:hypothetical protein
MTIVARRGQAGTGPRPRPLRFDRPTSRVAALTPLMAGPPGADLRHELARLALDLVVRTAEPADLPARWTTYPFGQEVDRTRAQLAPIRSRTALLASFSREASIGATRGIVEAGLPAGPVRIAYAIRWLELGDGRRRPAWASFVAGPVEIVAAAIPGWSAGGEAPGQDPRTGEIST